MPGTLSSRFARHLCVFRQYARKREAGGVPHGVFGGIVLAVGVR
jgi:hypothetical protein